MEKPKVLLLRAIQAYEKVDGATKLGSLRDAITDVLHEAYRKKVCNYTSDPLKNVEMLQQDAYQMFCEEEEEAEIKTMMAIPKKKLPLHIHDMYKFETTKGLFTKRLKGEDGKSINYDRAIEDLKKGK